MNSQEEYNNTKEQTDELVAMYMAILSKKKDGEYTAIEMPQYAPVDYLIYNRGVPKFYLEVKFRRHNKGQYREEKVPVSKYTFAYTFKATEKIPSYLLIKWKDATGLIDLNEPSQINSMIARHDRGDGSDIYAFYPADDFLELLDLDFQFQTRYVSII